MTSVSDRNTDARGKQGTERTEKIFSSITTDKGQCAMPDSIGYFGNWEIMGVRGK